MKYDDVMPVLTFLFGIFCMTMWYLEMFSDSRLGRILGTMTNPSLLSKNRSAICAPAFKFPRWVYADWQYAKRHGLLDESGNIDQEAWARHRANQKDLW